MLLFFTPCSGTRQSQGKGSRVGELAETSVLLSFLYGHSLMATSSGTAGPGLQAFPWLLLATSKSFPLCLALWSCGRPEILLVFGPYNFHIMLLPSLSKLFVCCCHLTFVFNSCCIDASQGASPGTLLWLLGCWQPSWSHHQPGWGFPFWTSLV